VVRDPLFNGANVSLSQFSTGNPNVDPEEADTTTVGVVYQPSWLPGFSTSVDWYSIDTKGAIERLGAQILVDDCAAGAVDLCALITRDPATNQLVFVQNQFLNVAKAKVSGIDVETSYNRSLELFGGAPESIGARVIASYLDENSITNRAVGTRNYAGQTSNGFNLPRLQVTAQIAYDIGSFRTVLQERFIARGTLDRTFREGIDIDDNRVGSAAYTDLDVSYTLTGVGGGDMEIFGHVTNLLDRAPPIASNFTDFGGATPTNQSVYDVLGRRYTLGVKLKL
jgi:iron complex outermembrane recepter protein